MFAEPPCENVSFDPAEYTPDRTATRITEIRNHLRDELLPGAETCSVFVADFIRYLDAWALHFQNQLSAPIEFLALVTRNLLEFALLLPVVFESAESRALFLNEAFRIDANDLTERSSKMFAVVGATLPRPSIEELDWLPHSTVRLVGKRDVFDAWVHKYCSKLMHPTAIMILVPDALTNPEKRIILCFFGLRYLGLSYNFLSKVTFSGTEP